MSLLTWCQVTFIYIRGVYYTDLTVRLRLSPHRFGSHFVNNYKQSDIWTEPLIVRAQRKHASWMNQTKLSLCTEDNRSVQNTYTEYLALTGLTARLPAPCPWLPTQCPWLPAQCPMLPTLCPVLPAPCPVLPTQCPWLPAQCPVLPTQCPVLPTPCPVLPAPCPVLPTQCPWLPAQCPVLPTQCPVLPAPCPVLPTQCPWLPSRVHGSLRVSMAPYAVSMAPYAVSMAPCTVSMAPYAVSMAPYTVSMAPYAVSMAPCAVSMAPCAVSMAPCAVSMAPYTVSMAPCAVSMAPCAVSMAPYAVSSAPFTVSMAPCAVSMAPWAGDIRCSLLRNIHSWFALRSVFKHRRVWHHIPLIYTILIHVRFELESWRNILISTSQGTYVPIEHTSETIRVTVEMCKPISEITCIHPTGKNIK